MEQTRYLSNRRIVTVAGSKEIIDHPKEKMDLAQAIGARIVREKNWLLLNGGASGIRKTREPTAIDYWASVGARDEATRLGLKAEDYIITLHPQETDHPLHNIGRVEVTKRKTPALRRFDLVARADAVVTIEGLAGLITILELCIALDKVLIPIPCTGGTSREAWDTYEEEITEKLGIDRASSDYILLTQGLAAIDTLADLVIRLLRRLLSPLCYVALPAGAIEIYKSVIIPTLENCGLRPITLGDLVDATSDIVDSVIESIRNARLVIADISNADPDVSYQIGIAEVLGKPIIPICEGSFDGAELLGRYPLDLRFRKVLLYSPDNVEAFRTELYRTVKLSIG